jgi:hypothetical protein
MTGMDDPKTHTTLLTFSNPGGAFVLDPSTVPQTPRGPEGRLIGAAREAFAVAMARRAEHIDRTGADPILLIATPDDPVGSRIIEDRWPGASRCMTAPAVIALRLEQYGQMFGLTRQQLDAGIKAAGVTNGESLWAFAVNSTDHRDVPDVRVLRVVDAPIALIAAPEAPPLTLAEWMSLSPDDREAKSPVVEGALCSRCVATKVDPPGKGSTTVPVSLAHNVTKPVPVCRPCAACIAEVWGAQQTVPPSTVINPDPDAKPTDAAA